MSVVSEVKQRLERSQIFNFNKSEAKECRDCSQRFHSKSKESKTGL